MTKKIVFRGREYPENWPEIRAAVLERAGHRCEWCGAKNHEAHPRTGSRVVLTTAHVYNMDPMDVDLANLAALCQRCHLTHDAGQHQRTAKGIEPSNTRQTPLYKTLAVRKPREVPRE